MPRRPLRTSALASTLVVLTLATGYGSGSAAAEPTPPSGDAELRPGATLAPFVIKDIVTVSGTDGDRREDTTDRIRRVLGAKVLFAKDSARLTAAARGRIQDIAREIRDNGSPAVSITGYTDNLGSAAHGLTLSRDRAEAVRDALRGDLTAGVSYTVRGLGESDPVADNSNEDGREKNRRVEVSFPRGS